MTRRKSAQLRRWALYLGTIALVVWVITLIDFSRVHRTMLNEDIAKELFPDIVEQAARNTLIFTVLGFSGGLALGLVLALMRLSVLRPYRWFATGYIEIFRGLPALLTIIFLGYGLPLAVGVRVPGTYGPGALALAMVAGAYMAETIRAGIEAVPKGQMEAARSLGMTHGRAMATVVIPQAFRIIIPPLTNELVLLLKDTALLSVLGTTAATEELTKFARDNVSTKANSTPLLVAGAIYLVMTIPLTQVAAYLERRGKRAR
jgi:polar amino acid transport system permease protein